jgi:hypothetical protein
MADSPHLDRDYVVGAVTPDLLIPRQVRTEPDGAQRTALTFNIALTLEPAPASS